MNATTKRGARLRTPLVGNALNAENIPMVKFQTTLKLLMEEKGVTASSVARSTGIAKSTLSEWLAGRKPLLDENIVKLARFFGVSVERLITGEDAETEIVREVIGQLDDGFISIHKGVYRVSVEKYVGPKKGRK